MCLLSSDIIAKILQNEKIYWKVTTKSHAQICIYIYYSHCSNKILYFIFLEDSSESVVRYDATKLGTAKVVNPNSSSIYIPVSSGELYAINHAHKNTCISVRAVCSVCVCV